MIIRNNDIRNNAPVSDEDRKKNYKKWTIRGLTGGQVHPNFEVRKEERMQQVSGFPSPGYKSMQTAPRVNAASGPEAKPGRGGTGYQWPTL